MTNSIELLEAIGGDAGLRHASANELERALAAMRPSDGLLRSAESGDRHYLVQELGSAVNQATQVHDSPIQGGFEEEDDTEDDSSEGGEKAPASERS